MTAKQAEEKYWRVLTTRPRAEKQVARRLAERGMEPFLPLHRSLRFWHDRRKWVEMPLFTSYVFVKTTDNERFTALDVLGVVRYVSFGQRMAVLSEAEIERVQLLCAYMGEVAIEQGNPQEGDEVEILGGHFKGQCGKLLKTDGKARLQIAIEGLACHATVEIEKDIVRKRM